MSGIINRQNYNKLERSHVINEHALNRVPVTPLPRAIT